MKEPDLRDWACRLLEDQLMRLAELRNANPRDPGFKLWRQTTLTVIQRVWPGNLPRSERFRRIPFTPPSPRPSRAQVREHFERGCGEATAYLRELIIEIQNGALDPSRPVEALVDPPMPPPGPSSVAASLAAPLPGEVSAGPAPPAPASGPPPDRAAPPPPIPGFQSSLLSAAPGEASPPGQPPRPPAAAGEGARRGPASRAPRTPRKSDRRALKEMLGFVDEPGAAGPPSHEESDEPDRPGATFGPPPPPPPSPAASLFPPPIGGGPSRPAPPPRGGANLFYGGPTPLDQAGSPEAEIDDGLAAEDEVDDGDFDAASAITDDDVQRLDENGEPTMGADPEELLRSAPWAAARAEIAAPALAGLHSPSAAALQALAGEVAELGVPEGQRAAARAALTDLARRIEDRSADWGTLRDAFALAMEYPPLARRVVPLLLPFLDLQ